ncbi:MAG: hypothetical protein CBC10_010765 [Gammaproteobacteria bacterium TMED50]|nr:MAG: hypothetical protein CBC10_010765 [Gammaproteobacteria bacterium TMED50]
MSFTNSVASGTDEQTRDKLARFLCGWMNGPRRY